MGTQLEIEYAALTDVGRMRSANEDFLGHAEYPWGRVFVVCDGMGGHVGGARASHIAVDSMLEFFARELWVEPVAALRGAVQFANEQIFATALNEPALKGMGTTCVVLLVQDSGIWLAHVGDSRIYIHSDGHLHKVTRDHSFVQGLVDKGLIPEEEAESHPRKNELMRALGIGPVVEIEVTLEAIYPKQGDVFMLCSDGLNGMLGDKWMEEVLSTEGKLETKAQLLIDAANAAGGTDNITVQLISITASPHRSNRFVAIKPPINMARTMPVQQPIAPEQLDPRSPLQRYWMAIVLCVVVLVLGILGISGAFSGNGDAEAKALALQDSLRKDSIHKVHIADSTHKADSARKVFVADSLHLDSINRKLIKQKPN